jgi:hypothetical protein
LRHATFRRIFGRAEKPEGAEPSLEPPLKRDLKVQRAPNQFLFRRILAGITVLESARA